MEQFATPGSIVITAETLAQIEARVDVRPLGRVVVKGLTEGVEAYEVLGAPGLRGEISEGLVCVARRREP
jgi:class 3 adenylate cyclase